MQERLRALRPVCKGCGIQFTPKNKRQRYHNEYCRETYYKIHYFPQTFADKICLNCGSVFSTSMPKKQAYCNSVCREEARDKRADIKAEGKLVKRQISFNERTTTLEHDKYKCTVCGKSPADGIILDIVVVNTSLTTICMRCRSRKEVIDGIIS